MADYLNFECHGVFVYLAARERKLECMPTLAFCNYVTCNGGSSAHTPSPYNTFTTNESGVRIPSILWMQSIRHLAGHPIDPIVHFRDNYRQQLGTHVFLLQRELMFVQTSLSRAATDAQPSYTVSTSRPIHSVYPVLKNRRAGGQLCLGLHFTQRCQRGERDNVFFRTHVWKAGGVLDLTEDFFDDLHKSLAKGAQPVWANTQRNLPGGNHFAIYVGAGARLVVEDYRSTLDTRENKEWQGVVYHEDEVTYSLFQPGSLVLVEGFLHLSIPIPDPVTNCNFTKYCSAALSDRTYFPKEISQADSISSDDKIVIILGDTPSMHSTISWHLSVTQCRVPSDGGLPPISTLTVPEGGRIQACLPWVEGIHEVYWRHRYECLYEAVLRSQTFGGKYTPKYGRQQPSPAMVKLILGSELYFTAQRFQRDFQMNFSPFITQCLANYVDYSLRYPFTEIERVAERLAAAPPSVAPIMLPIAQGDNLVYFEPGLPVEHNTQTDVYSIRGIEYRKKSNVFIEYEWKPIGYLYYYQTNSHLIGNWTDLPLKCGIDYIVYQKTQKPVGVIHSYYLERSP